VLTHPPLKVGGDPRVKLSTAVTYVDIPFTARMACHERAKQVEWLPGTGKNPNFFHRGLVSQDFAFEKGSEISGLLSPG